LSNSDHAYHRRRSEIELEKALAADAHESAIAHLELARLHRAKRITLIKPGAVPIAFPIGRTDKEA